MMGLRPWTAADAGALLPLLTDPQVRQWTGALSPAAWIDTVLTDAHRHSFAVVRDGAIVGNVAVKTPAPGRWEIGYWVAAPARRQGVAAWAVEQVTGWAFTRFGMDELALLHNVANVASCGVARRCGYPLRSELPPSPGFPLPGHLHVRRAAERG
ncbi:GNAT family N-acetyltransferase [Actinoplanes sp. NPDC020271]|uniref:GNAT family N-acetyltransferase n=1 Tax=Actinoplanes sp. NPDC020271 TaxID=3363896 RepID=UPI00378FC82F